MAAGTIEERLAKLEEQVARLQVEKGCATEVQWWQKRFGAFKDNPYYDAIVEAGAEYRRSQPTAADQDAEDVSPGL